MVWGPSGSTHSVASGPSRVQLVPDRDGHIVGVVHVGAGQLGPGQAGRAHHDPGLRLHAGLHLDLPLVGDRRRPSLDRSQQRRRGAAADASTSR